MANGMTVFGCEAGAGLAEMGGNNLKICNNK